MEESIKNNLPSILKIRSLRALAISIKASSEDTLKKCFAFGVLAMDLISLISLSGFIPCLL